MVKVWTTLFALSAAVTALVLGAIWVVAYAAGGYTTVSAGPFTVLHILCSVASGLIGAGVVGQYLLRRDDCGECAVEASLREHVRRSDELTARLQEERAKLSAAVEQMGEGIMFVDLEGRVLLVNRVMTQLWGDRLDATSGIFGCHPPDKVAGVRELLAQLGCDERSRLHRDVTHNGHLLETTLAPIRSEQGVPYGVMIMTRDTTEQRRLQDQLIRQEKLSVLGKLAGSVAHELNNPLTAIAMFADLIVKHPCPCPSIGDYARTIQQNIASCKRIAQQLLAYGAAEQPHRPVDLREALDETLTLLTPLMNKHRVACTTPCNGTALTVLADPTQLRQAFTNILLNAIRAVEHSPRRNIRLDIEVQGHAAVVSFQDTGSGIAPEHQGSIFEHFFTTYPEGTGLGLAIVKGIVDRHQGRVWFETEPQEGTTFFVELPLYEPSADR
jgi:PAS domain S-box-containing protein